MLLKEWHVTYGSDGDEIASFHTMIRNVLLGTS
jgi:hypothetical protein